MIFKPTYLAGSFIIELETIADNRGFFARTFCRNEFEKQGLNASMVQCNLSYNRYRGTLRGMHFQKAPYAEAKLVRCIAGAVFDVIIDLRPNSDTYLGWKGIELSSQNRKMFYVPEGFAHGYQSLTDHSEVFYQVSQSYVPASEAGVRWDDPFFSIQWPEYDKKIISTKDSQWPDFSPEDDSRLRPLSGSSADRP
jgi:dTDP-4-dehydrorhamnose 3,5-epimerase